jgi:hypothetical protein
MEHEQMTPLRVRVALLAGFASLIAGASDEE